MSELGSGAPHQTVPCEVPVPFLEASMYSPSGSGWVQLLLESTIPFCCPCKSEHLGNRGGLAVLLDYT